jgi:eukaryotic-like serine/threonine-protein kinase
VVDAAGKRSPLDTQMQLLWLPAIEAQVALDKKNPAAALSALETASPIELGQIEFVINISCLYPVYIRGEAYLAAYQDFLRLWEDGDPDIPTLKEAKAEYAELQ